MAVDIKGILAVVVTPFDDSGKVDENALRSHIRFLLDEGKVHGIIPAGSTGEFAALTDAEYRLVVETVIDEAGGAAPVVAGAAAVSTAKTIENSRFARQAGADGVMVVSPFYCHPDQRELLIHFKTLAENVDIPIMLYNNPGTSGVDIMPDVVAELAEYDNVNYIKESSGDMSRLMEITRLCGDGIKVLCGCDTLTLEMFTMGAVGWIAPAANIIPQKLVRFYELAVEEGDAAGARDLYFKLMPLLKMFEDSGKYIQFSKAGLDIVGRSCGKPRPPLLPPTDEELAKLKSVLPELMR